MTRQDIILEALEKNIPNKFFAELRKFLCKRYRNVPPLATIRAEANQHGRIHVYDPLIKQTMTVHFQFKPRFVEMEQDATRRMFRNVPSPIDNAVFAVGMTEEFYFSGAINALMTKKQIQHINKMLTEKTDKPA